MRVRILAVALVFGACGGDGEDGRDGADGQDGTVITTTDLPVGSKECPAGGIQITVDGVPRALCNGEPGAAGAAGAMGAPGKDGEASGYRPVLIVGCNVAVDFYTGGDGVSETYLAHDSVIYSNGDADVSCVATAGDSNGAGNRYYPAGTVGAAKLGCTASIDYPPGGDGVQGYMDFSLGNEGPTATYHDAPNPMNGDFFVFEDSNCQVRKWSGTAWVAGTLADLD